MNSVTARARAPISRAKKRYHTHTYDACVHPYVYIWVMLTMAAALRDLLSLSLSSRSLRSLVLFSSVPLSLTCSLALSLSSVVGRSARWTSPPPAYPLMVLLLSLSLYIYISLFQHLNLMSHTIYHTPRSCQNHWPRSFLLLFALPCLALYTTCINIWLYISHRISLALALGYLINICIYERARKHSRAARATTICIYIL